MAKKIELNNIFCKIYIQSHIIRKHSNSDFLFLDLIREEIKIIILNTISEELEIIITSLICNPKIDHIISEQSDLLIKLIILASKNKILTKLKLQPPKYKKYRKLKKNWLLNLVESESYNTLKLLITNLKSFKTKPNKTSINYTKLLLENWLLKISDLIIYDIFLTKKVLPQLLELYSLDLLLILSYSNKIDLYLSWKTYINSILLKRTRENISGNLLTFTRNGIIKRKTIIESFYHDFNFINFTINSPLHFAENLIFSIFQFFVRR
jgi:hypothetical protein